MFLLNPKHLTLRSPDRRSRDLIEATVAFFEAKGKANLRRDDLART
jgi:acyl-CoA dehydrogenase